MSRLAVVSSSAVGLGPTTPARGGLGKCRSLHLLCRKPRLGELSLNGAEVLVITFAFTKFRPFSNLPPNTVFVFRLVGPTPEGPLRRQEGWERKGLSLSKRSLLLSLH